MQKLQNGKLAGMSELPVIPVDLDHIGSDDLVTKHEKIKVPQMQS